MPTEPEATTFSRDVFGRFVCNTFDEAKASLLGESGPNGAASPFQIIIVGGGTFGGALASALCSLDRATPAFDDPFTHYASRIVVLEAGPFFLPEHGQNLPLISGINTMPAETIASLRALGRADQPLEQVWGLPWHSDDAFCGLAYCIGGRSIYWGGWSPRFLDTEMPTQEPSAGVRMAVWPQRVKNDLQGPRADGGPPFFDEAARALGVNDPNDFINGKLHVALRKKFFEDYAKISYVIPLAELPGYMDPAALGPVTMAAATPAGGTPADANEALKLDAPYAVETRARPGFFPTNKWSSVPGLMSASRKAATDSQQTGNTVVNDSRRQLMVVPRCNVKRLITQVVPTGGGTTRRVVGVETTLGTMPVPTNGVVVLALGAIESTRLALNSFGDVPFAGEIGQNLMMHLRTNTVFTVPRSLAIFNSIPWEQFQVSAIQIRGRITHADGTHGHFHLQITASGVPTNVGNAEAQLFQKVPDLDTIDSIATTPTTHVAIAIRGIGEMESLNPGSSVQLDPEIDQANGMRRAFVRINDDQNREIPAIRNLTVPKDSNLLQAMVQATNDVLGLFGKPPRAVNSNANASDQVDIKLDGVGTTYHECGTLRMGDDPATSVTTPDGRFHQVSNAYVTDMSVIPTSGSANPMQPGVALARRLARHLARPSVPTSERVLFNGSTAKLWRMVGQDSNAFGLFDDRLLLLPARGQLGLLYCLVPTPPNFELSLEWRMSNPFENGGIFVRFPDPNKAPPGKEKGFGNPAYVAIEYGFEVQLCGVSNGSPDDPDVAADRFRLTGAFYNCPNQDIDETVPIDHNGGWNRMRIRVHEQVYEVYFDYPGGPSRRRSRFENIGRTKFVINTNNQPRGVPGTAAAPSYIGLQSHFDTREIGFRDVRLRAI